MGPWRLDRFARVLVSKGGLICPISRQGNVRAAMMNGENLLNESGTAALGERKVISALQDESGILLSAPQRSAVGHVQS
jgi:hypothetical protein